MADDVKPEVIKKTQDLLGKYFKKPPLTEKLLRKPPFRFLHDIVTAVIRETGFLGGLFSEDELNSENVADKESKLAFLTKLIDVVKLISGTNLTVRPSKIIAGQEPNKTNELLQAIGRALDKKVSSAEAIEHYKKNVEKKGKATARGKVTSKDDKRAPSRQTSQTRKPPEKEKSSMEKRRSSSTSKLTTNEIESRNNGKRNKEDEAGKAAHEHKDAHQNIGLIEIPPAEPAQVRVPTSAQRRKPSSAKPKQNTASTPREQAESNFNEGNTILDKKAEEHGRRKDSASRTKRSLYTQNSGSQDRAPTPIMINNDKKESSDITQTNEKEISSDDTLPRNTDQSEPIILEGQRAQPENETSTPQDGVSRPRTSLRPPTARPISARPAAPRIRGKPEVTLNEEISTPMGNISLIIEGLDAKDEDDAEDMVVLETRGAGGAGDSLESSFKMNNQLTQEHGHLVAQILETQRELINNENVDVLPKKTDIEWDASSKRDREVVGKEIDKLRGTIQTLTRATNPLGKLLDYLQEDTEMMQKELLDWRNQYVQINEQLEREKVLTKELIDPMKENLKDIDNNIRLQLDKIYQAKSQIMKNDRKIQKLLNGHS